MLYTKSPTAENLLSLCEASGLISEPESWSSISEENVEEVRDHCLSLLIADRDAPFLRVLQEGVPLGFSLPMPHTNSGKVGSRRCLVVTRISAVATITQPWVNGV